LKRTFDGGASTVVAFGPKTVVTMKSADDLHRIQHSLHGRPRTTLGYMTPLEKLAELVALTS